MDSLRYLVHSPHMWSTVALWTGGESGVRHSAARQASDLDHAVGTLVGRQRVRADGTVSVTRLIPVADMTGMQRANGMGNVCCCCGLPATESKDPASLLVTRPMLTAPPPAAAFFPSCPMEDRVPDYCLHGEARLLRRFFRALLGLVEREGGSRRAAAKKIADWVARAAKDAHVPPDQGKPSSKEVAVPIGCTRVFYDFEVRPVSFESEVGATSASSMPGARNDLGSILRPLLDELLGLCPKDNVTAVRRGTSCACTAASSGASGAPCSLTPPRGCTPT